MTAPLQRVGQSSRAAPTAAPLPQGRDAQLSLGQLWPYIEKYAQQYGADPKVMAGVIAQESSFKNYGVHFDGTGHGLIGLDDNGLLPSFEKWSGLSIGRGANARTIPPDKQVEYLAKALGDYARQFGGDQFAAARAWHRGTGAMNDANGRQYEQLVKNHIADLFPGGKTPAGGTVPDAPGSPGGPGRASEPGRPSGSRAKPQAEAGSTDYRIQRGDTLWGIASRLKAQGMSGSEQQIIGRICQMNPKIKDPNLIYAGDSLKLPSPNGKAFGSDDMSTGVGTAIRKRGSKVTGDDAPAPVSDAPPKGGKYDVPYINQYRPVGAERGYSNGPANCGPTSMAMIARAFGYGKGMSDAQLINHLGSVGGTSGNGTGVNGIVAMARDIGKSAQMKGPGANVEWIAEQLKAGKLVVANGDYFAMPPHQNESRTSGHYVCVAGLDANGNFIVRDPADQNVKTITPAQLTHFLNSNPNGGYQIAIG